MDISQSNWNEADGSNSTAAPDGAPEGMAPSGVNDTMRAMMGATKRWYDQTVPLVTGGTSTAYTLSYSVAPTALADGMTHLVQFNAINGAAPTLNVNALGAKPLHFWASGGWGAWPANMVAIDQIVRVTYNAAAGTYRAYSMPTVLNQSVSGASTIDFAGIPTTVRNLQVTFAFTVGTNNVNLKMQFYNSSGSVDSGASAYSWIFVAASDGSNTPISGSSLATDSCIELGLAISNNSALGIAGDITIPDIQGVKATQCNYRSNYGDQGGSLFVAATGSGIRGANGNITGIRILPSGGVFTGKVSVAMS